jgi:hypothetical protein
MKTKLLIISFFLIAVVKSFGWRIEGPATVCPGQTATYKFYPETGIAYYCNGYGKATIAGTAVQTESYGDKLTGQTQLPIIFPVEMIVQWPYGGGTGKVEFQANTCNALNSNVYGSLTVTVGPAPALSLSSPGVCSISETVTVSASSGCAANFNWTITPGWIFTSNNTNTIVNGGNQVTVKPLPGTNPLSVANVTATAVSGSLVKSVTATKTVSYYPAVISTPYMTGSYAVCNTTSNQIYSFRASDPSSDIRWSIGPAGNTKAMIVGPSNENNVTVDIDNYASAGSFIVQLELSNRCAPKVTASQTVSVSVIAPSSSPVVSGPSSTCNSGETIFSVGSSVYGVSYDVQPASAVSSSYVSSAGDLIADWNDSFTGAVTVKARFSNGCGVGPWSAAKSVTVSSGAVPLAPVVNGPSSACNSGGDSYFNIGFMTSNVIYELLPAAAVNSYLISPYGQLNVDWNNSFAGIATVRARQSNACGPGAWSAPLSVSVINGVCRTADADFTEKPEMEIYPNPTKGRALLQINTPDRVEAEVKIFDSKGHVVLSEETVPSGTELDFGAEFTPGLYLVKVSYGQTEKIYKFVKE